MTVKTSTVFHMVCDSCGDYLQQKLGYEFSSSFVSESELDAHARKEEWMTHDAKDYCCDDCLDDATLITDHSWIGVAGHPDDTECTYRSDGTDATYCGRSEDDHRWLNK